MSFRSNTSLFIPLLAGLLICNNANSGNLSNGDLDISYRYLELGYVNIDTDDVLPGIDADADGFGIRFSTALHPNVHMFASYSSVDTDNFDIDVTTWEAGLGYNHDIAEKTDIVLTVGYGYADADANNVDVDDSGYSLGAGLRHMVINDFIRASVLDGIELKGQVDYVDFDDFGDDTSLTAGMLFHFNPAFSLGIEGTWGDDASGYAAGIRYTY